MRFEGVAWMVALALPCAAGCGDARTPGRLAAALTIEAVVASDVQSVELFLFGSHSPSGRTIDCPALAHLGPQMRGDAPERFHAVLPLADTHIPDLLPEMGLVLVVDAYPAAGGTGHRAGYGCAGPLTIEEGRATPVTVQIGPVP